MLPNTFLWVISGVSPFWLFQLRPRFHQVLKENSLILFFYSQYRLLFVLAGKTPTILHPESTSVSFFISSALCATNSFNFHHFVFHVSVCVRAFSLLLNAEVSFCQPGCVCTLTRHFHALFLHWSWTTGTSAATVPPKWPFSRPKGPADCLNATLWRPLVKMKL